MQIIDVFEVLQKGIDNENSLSELEWPIFVVSYLESIAEMEGWDHFFTYSMKWYPKLSQALEMIDDFSSIKVIESYVEHFKVRLIKFEARSINVFLTNASDEYFELCPDWREEFTALGDTRWRRFTDYYESIDVQLKT